MGPGRVGSLSSAMQEVIIQRDSVHQCNDMILATNWHAFENKL